MANAGPAPDVMHRSSGEFRSIREREYVVRGRTHSSYFHKPEPFETLLPAGLLRA